MKHASVEPLAPRIYTTAIFQSGGKASAFPSASLSTWPFTAAVQRVVGAALVGGRMGEHSNLAADGQLMAVSVRNRDSIEPQSPFPCNAPLATYSFDEMPRQEYAVSPDGQRFLLRRTTVDWPASPFTIGVDWTTTLAEKIVNLPPRSRRSVTLEALVLTRAVARSRSEVGDLDS